LYPYRHVYTKEEALDRRELLFLKSDEVQYSKRNGLAGRDLKEKKKRNFKTKGKRLVPPSKGTKKRCTRAGRDRH